jgi:cold shock CspA family protein/ribosome-associated translation inhibitor RaiA
VQLPLQITFHGLSHSDPIEQYVRVRAAKLDVMAPRVTSCRVALELPHRHGRHGGHYRVSVDLTLPGGEVFAARSPDEAKSQEDLYAAIDATFDSVGRQLQDFTRRQRADVKAHEASRHGNVAKLFPYEGYGFLRTEEGEELYFHRNSVLGATFDKLKVGDRVRYVEDDGEGGPHASTVSPM